MERERETHWIHRESQTDRPTGFTERERGRERGRERERGGERGERERRGERGRERGGEREGNPVDSQSQRQRRKRKKENKNKSTGFTIERRGLSGDPSFKVCCPLVSLSHLHCFGTEWGWGGGRVLRGWILTIMSAWLPWSVCLSAGLGEEGMGGGGVGWGWGWWSCLPVMSDQLLAVLPAYLSDQLLAVLPAYLSD